jgi:chaperonin cofactor prefoldin
MTEARPQIYEKEVKLDDSEPLSMKKDMSEATDDILKEKMQYQHSTPITDVNKMDGSTLPEDFKSEILAGPGVSMKMPKPTAKGDNFDNCIVQLDPDTISHRLIESVSMVTDLLQSNRQLRDTINTLNKEKETMENDNCILQSDNIELRDRIEILQSIIKANASDYENYDWRKIIEEENEQNLETYKAGSSKNVENVVTTIVDSKKENRMLKRRIEHLELQISHLTNHFDYQGNIEPTRAAMLNQVNNNYMQGNVDDFVPEPSPVSYYDQNGNYPTSDQDYTNAGNTYNNNMRSTGFSKSNGRSKITSKSSLRDSGNKRSKRPDVTIRGGKKKSGYGHATNYSQYQNGYPNQTNISVGKANQDTTQEKDEALKMLYDMMMTRVSKKKRTN